MTLPPVVGAGGSPAAGAPEEATPGRVAGFDVSARGWVGHRAPASGGTTLVQLAELERRHLVERVER